MGFFDSIKSGWNDFTSAVSSVATSAKNTVVDVFRPAVDTVTNKIVLFVANKVEGVVSFAGKQIDKVYMAGASVITNVGGGTGNLLTSTGKAVESVGSGVQGLGSGIGDSMMWIALAAGVIGMAIIVK